MSLLGRVERALDRARGRERGPVGHLRIEAYVGHGGPGGVVVRARVLDGPPGSEAVVGEGVGAAVRRTLGTFLTDELAGVPLRVSVGDATTLTRSDADGYVRVELHPTPDSLEHPWTRGRIELSAPYRGVAAAGTDVDVRVDGPDARIGVLSDVDDTILVTGVQRVGQMLRHTFGGSALTRTPFPGAAELYRDLAGSGNPVFYVSSSPWNLHAFLLAFLRHRDFPLGPLLLRDLLGTGAGREQKHARIREVLAVHPQLDFVLVGDSGEDDPRTYRDVVREHPDRIRAVWIREVRLDPGDGRVEQVSADWGHDVPFVLAQDSAAIRAHAVSIGLL